MVKNHIHACWFLGAVGFVLFHSFGMIPFGEERRRRVGAAAYRPAV
jgi:hypothetical protein